MRALLVTMLAALPAMAQPARPGPDDPAVVAAARAALPRAEIRTIQTDVRSVAGIGAGVGGVGRTISGEVSQIATVQRRLEGEGLAVRMVDGRLEVSLPGDILFDFDKATIRPNAVPTLEKVKAAAAGLGDRPIRIEGHTDAIGTPAHNQPLSEARARAVATWLGDAGLARARITSAGFGATRPVAPNRTATGRDDPAGRQKNRRVTVSL